MLVCVNRDAEYDVVLGCRDSRVRVISGSIVAFDYAVEGPVTCVTNIASTPIPPEFPIPPKGFQEIIYATQRGQIGQLLVRLRRGCWALAVLNDVCVTQADPSTIRRGWTGTKDPKLREAAVNCITTGDINGDGVEEILVCVCVWCSHRLVFVLWCVTVVHSCSWVVTMGCCKCTGSMARNVSAFGPQTTGKVYDPLLWARCVVGCGC